MKSMKIYVAGPYTGSTLEEIEENVQRAMEVGLKIWKKGHFPYIPHLTHWPDLRAQEQGIPMDWTDYMGWQFPQFADQYGVGDHLLPPLMHSLDKGEAITDVLP